MNPTPPPVLLLSGAGLDPWIWDDVRARLRVDSVVAPRPSTHATASLQAYAEAAVSAAPAGAFTVVAHSSGGVVASEVARLVPERVEALLAVAAVVPSPGGSFVSAMPVPNRWVLSTAIRVGGTRPPDKAVRRGLGAGLDADMVDRLVADLTPESRRLYLDTAAHRAWTGRRGFLVTGLDRELPPGLQRRFARRLGADWIGELDTGHLPMLEDPGATAGAIESFLSGGEPPVSTQSSRSHR